MRKRSGILLTLFIFYGRKNHFQNIEIPNQYKTLTGLVI